MLYEFLILWLAGIIVSGYVFWQTKSSFFFGFMSILLFTFGVMVTFEGVQFQSIVTVNGVTSQLLTTVRDSATLFLGWAGAGLGISGLVITIYQVLKEVMWK